MGQLDQRGVTAGTVLETPSSRYHVHPVPWSSESLKIFRAYFS